MAREIFLCGSTSRGNATAKGMCRPPEVAKSTSPTLRVVPASSYFVRQTYLFKNPVTEFQVSARTDVARMANVDVDDTLDPSRPGAHHDDPIGKLNRLFDVVGYEDDCLTFSPPDT